VREVDVTPLSPVQPVDYKRGPSYENAKHDKEMGGKVASEKASLTYRMCAGTRRRKTCSTKRRGTSRVSTPGTVTFVGKK
jgi:hypothetical protein